MSESPPASDSQIEQDPTPPPKAGERAAQDQSDGSLNDSILDESTTPSAAESGSGTTNSTLADELPGKLLGEFHLLRQLGSGGMAEVYLAEQVSLNRHVAVKVLHPEFVSDGTYLKRFKQEAKAAGGLNHANIVQVYVIGESNDMHYIAQEYVQGRNLREFLAKKGPPSVTMALHIMKQVASALEAAGEAGIVHRDIKPENIMITRKGDVKVADFGLAQLTREHEGERVGLTQVGITMGTPLYMSPEQVNGSKVDRRSDIYSFGVTCYHMLAGRPPFRGETALAIAVKHLKEEAESLQQRRPDLPRRLCEAIQKMMAKEPADRYQDAAAVLDDLKKIEKSLKNQPSDLIGLDWEEFDSEPHSMTAWSQFKRFFSWQENSQVLAFIGICLLVAGVSAGIGWYMRPTNPFDVPPSQATRVPRQETVAAQVFYAQTANTVAAWKAVKEYWPNERTDVRLADVRLAWLYLTRHELAEAEALYDQFIVSETDDELRAIGLAGKSIIATIEDEFELSQTYIADLRSEGLEDELQSEMQRQLATAEEVNKQELGIDTGLDDLLQSPQNSDVDESQVD